MPERVVSTTKDRLSKRASLRRRNASRAAWAGDMLRAMASGSITSKPLNPLMRVSVDFPHPLGPATIRRVGNEGWFSRISSQDG